MDYFCPLVPVTSVRIPHTVQTLGVISLESTIFPIHLAPLTCALFDGARWRIPFPRPHRHPSLSHTISPHSLYPLLPFSLSTLPHSRS